MVFITAAGENSAQKEVPCEGTGYASYIIGEREAQRGQVCLINYAKGMVAFSKRMAGVHGDHDFQGSILAIASRDEHDRIWKALILSADEHASDLRYIGTIEMEHFYGINNHIKELKELKGFLKKVSMKTDRLLRVKKEVESELDELLETVGRRIRV